MHFDGFILHSHDAFEKTDYKTNQRQHPFSSSSLSPSLPTPPALSRFPHPSIHASLPLDGVLGAHAGRYRGFPSCLMETG